MDIVVLLEHGVDMLLTQQNVDLLKRGADMDWTDTTISLLEIKTVVDIKPMHQSQSLESDFKIQYKGE